MTNKNKSVSVAQTHDSFRRKLSSYLRSLAARRNSRVVTADDVHTFLDRSGGRYKVNTRLSLINTVLRQPMFIQEGVTTSRRPVAKGRTINMWAVK